MGLVIFKRVLLGDGPVKEFQSPILKCDACVRGDGGTQPLVNSGRIAVLGVVICFGAIRWWPIRNLQSLRKIILFLFIRGARVWGRSQRLR